MGLQRDKIPVNLHNCTDEAIAFLTRWNDKCPYIEAHTSGSTGAPKNIRLLKSDMKASAESTNRFFNISRSSTLYCPLSADYIAGKMMIVRALVAGASLWMEEPSNQLQLTCSDDIDLIAVVPSQVPSLLRSYGQRKIGNILAGGAQLPRTMARSIISAGATAYVSYGMTETCSHVALRKVGAGGDEIYEAMPDITFATDERDCLIVKSAGRSFGELHTNDIVRLVDSRHFIWKGRYDNVINSGGIKIYPEEIEVMIQHVIPSGVEFYIARENDDKWGETPVLVISKDTGDNGSLLEAARRSVNHYAQRPSRIRVEEIRHTSSGKIIRI